jgi:hypothetical protein
MPKGRAVMPKYARADRARLFKIEHLARVVLARNTRRAFGPNLTFPCKPLFWRAFC